MALFIPIILNRNANSTDAKSNHKNNNINNIIRNNKENSNRNNWTIGNMIARPNYEKKIRVKLHIVVDGNIIASFIKEIANVNNNIFLDLILFTSIFFIINDKQQVTLDYKDKLATFN